MTFTVVFMYGSQHKTIESVLQRGEKLDNLVERSTALSAQSKMFYKTAKKVHIFTLFSFLDRPTFFPYSKTLAAPSCEALYRECPLYLTFDRDDVHVRIPDGQFGLLSQKEWHTCPHSLGQHWQDLTCLHDSMTCL
jgi:hypothetical protein